MRFAGAVLQGAHPPPKLPDTKGIVLGAKEVSLGYRYRADSDIPYRIRTVAVAIAEPDIHQDELKLLVAHFDGHGATHSLFT